MKFLIIFYYNLYKGGIILSLNCTVMLFSLILSAVIILFVSYKSKRFFTSLFLTAFSGLSGLFAVHILSRFIPVFLPVNVFTAGVSLISGLPGVIALLISAVTV